MKLLAHCTVGSASSTAISSASVELRVFIFCLFDRDNTALSPIIVNVTGGLQDQCRFEDENGEWIKFTPDFATNHTGRYKKHGKWVKPVYPAAINLQGSIPTPYIFDDRADFREIGQALYEWYKTPKEERKAAGQKGVEFIRNSEVGMSRDSMCQRVIDSLDGCFETFQPRNRFELHLV